MISPEEIKQKGGAGNVGGMGLPGKDVPPGR